MKKERQIGILKDRIRLLGMENGQLHAENERLNSRIMANTRMKDAGLGQENGILDSLESRKAEYEHLVAECIQVKHAYQEALDQMNQTMRECRKDTKAARKGQGAARWRRTFG